MTRDVTPIPKPPKRGPKKRRPVKPVSDKRLAEREQREAVRAEVHDRDGCCVGPAMGLPGACSSPHSHRPPLEVNETHKRSTHPGSHLDAAKAVLMCQFHHSMITSPSGDIRELAERVGLIVRATT